MSDPQRILVISNLYPPCYLGGYELGCRDVVEALRHRGHQVSVATSVYRQEDTVEGQIDCHRVLTWTKPSALRLNKFRLFISINRDIRKLRAIRRSLKPVVVLVFNTWGLHQAILAEFDSWTGVKRAQLLSDYAFDGSLLKDPWLQFWRYQPASPLKRYLKSGVAKMLRLVMGTDPSNVESKFPCLLFTSCAVQRYYHDHGIHGEREGVIYWGIPMNDFACPRATTYRGRLLFSGQLRADKGVHTLVEAMGLLPADLRNRLRLTIVGTSQQPDFEKRLRMRVGELQLSEVITFTGHVPRERIPELCAEHDVFVFPSEWEEPFSISLLEGMAAGLSVVGTTTGGSAELLEHGVNAWTFQAGDPEALADALVRVDAQPELAMQRAAMGQKRVQERFTIAVMARRIEEFLSI